MDVAVKETAICIVDETGAICSEGKVPSHPEDLVRVLTDPAWALERIGLEAGLLSPWLFSGLAEAGLPVTCIETRHTKAFLKAQPNKSDRIDARGIAQMMRVNLSRPVHVKTLPSQKRRALLTARKLLQEKAIAIDNDIRGLLRNFVLKVGMVGAVKFAHPHPRAYRSIHAANGRFAMGSAVLLRDDFDGAALRQLARQAKDANQARRLLALATIYDGGSRSDAARISSVTLQIVRDWVLRFNERGPTGW